MKDRCPARLKDFLRDRLPRANNRLPPRRPTGTTAARRGGTSTSTGLTRPGGYSNASRRQAMMSAEARDFPGLRSRYGEARPRRQVAAIDEEECQEEAVAALYEEMASEDPLTNSAEEEDFPEGQ